MKQLKASVVIPAYNEENYIRACLNSLSKQTYQNKEIIIVDDGSKDSTIKIIKEKQKKLKYLRLIKGQHKGPGFSRNLGAKNAKGEILVFVDADMTFDKDYLKNLIAPMQKDKKIIGTTHNYEIATNISNIWSFLWGRVRVGGGKEGYVKGMVIFRAIRKKIFLNKGGFDPKYGYADDQTLWLKYKMQPYVAKNTICYHRNPETLKEVYKQSKWIGASIDNSLTRTPITKYITPFLLLISSIFVIPFLSLKKAFQINSIKHLFTSIPQFVTIRYFGTLFGITKKIFTGENTR